MRIKNQTIIPINTKVKQNYILKMWLLAASCAVASLAWAEPVGKDVARKIAAKYIANPEMQQTTALTRAPQTDTPPAYYLFTNTSNNQFVIISGESQLNELVGYGTLSADKAKNPIPEEFKTMLQRYERVVSAVRTKTSQVPAAKFPQKREVLPLLTCHWEQNYPFNQYTPKQDGVNTPTGCVATATAQLLYFHKWPKARPESYIKSEGSEAQKSADYLWEDMRDRAKDMNTRGGDAVGVLMRDVGKAVHMSYFRLGSSSNLHRAMEALRNDFGYSVRHVYKDYMLASTFQEILLNELADGYPVLVCGGSHVFVFDGYDRRGFVHVNWGWGGEFDGYFDINTIYLNVSGFGLRDGKFYEEIEVVFAHPKDGQHKEFATTREIETRSAHAFTIAEKNVERGTVMNAKIEKIGSNNPINGSLGRFTGKVALGLYDDKGIRVKLFNSIQTGLMLSSIFTTTSIEFNNLDFAELPNGTYTLKPLSNELIEQPSTYSGWQPIAYANTQTVELTSNRIIVKDIPARVPLALERKPEVLAPLYQGSGDQGMIGIVVRNDGWEEVRGNLFVEFEGKDNGIKFTAPNQEFVCARRLETTAMRAPILTSYATNGVSNALLAGRYIVSFFISVDKGDKTFEKIPITTDTPIEIEVLPNTAPYKLSIKGIDFLTNGKVSDQQVFDPKETQTLGLMALAELRGSKGYSGALRYRAMDIDDGTFTELGSKSYVSFQPFAYITPKSTLVEFPLNRLKSGHTYEVHVEIDKDGQWTDVWNNVTPRVQFAVESSLSTDISSVKTTSKSPEVYNLQGVRITTPTDQLPKGIYIINGKKVKK